MLRSHVVFARDLRVLRQLASTPSLFWPGKRWSSTKDESTGGGDAPTKRKRRQEKIKETTVTESEDEAPKKKRGRPRKTPLAETTTTQRDSTKDPIANYEPDLTSTIPRRRRKSGSADLPPRIAALASPHHNSLPIFLRHARLKNLSPRSTVYRGTHYEYTCIRALGSRLYNFELYRAGRAGDLGVDLVGWWKLPVHSSSSDGNGQGEGAKGAREEGEEEGEGEGVKKGKRKRRTWRRLKVLAQCKLTTSTGPKPAMVRELEGAFAGAPAGWNASTSSPGSMSTGGRSSTPTDAVLAVLLSTAPATKGVVAALQRSRWPMGLLQITPEGEVKQFLWNAVAERRAGLEGMGVVVRYADYQGKKVRVDAEGEGEGEAVDVKQSVRLSWMGRLWRA